MRAHENNPSLYLAKLTEVVGYVIKGNCPKAGVALELERTKAKGRVMGKRCEWSRNIWQH